MPTTMLGTAGASFLALLAVGLVMLAAAGELAARRLSSGVWQRTLWRGVVLAMFAWVVLQATGLGPAAVQVARQIAASSRAVAVAPPVSLAPVATNVWLNAPSEMLDGTPDWSYESTSESVMAPAVPATMDAPPVAMASVPATSSAGWWGVALAGVWLGGTLLLVVRGLALRWRAARLLAQGRAELGQPINATVRRYARLLGLTKSVRVVTCRGLAVPVAAGIWRPTIGLPESFGRQFSMAEQEAMLLHELGHLAAGDPRWQWLAEWAVACCWWHPAAWWIRRKLAVASELAADEAAALAPEGPENLAAALVAFGRRLSRPRLQWVAADGNGFRSGLGRRVERLLNLKQDGSRRCGPGRLASVQATVLGGLVVLTVLGTAWLHGQADTEPGATPMNVITQSWRRSLAAMTVALCFGPTGAVVAEDKEPAPPPQGEAKPPRERPGRSVRPEGEARPPRERPEGEGGDRPEGPRRRGGDWRQDPAANLDSMPPEIRELFEQRRKLEEQARALQSKMRELGEGEKDQAEKIKAEMKQLREKIGEIAKKLPAPPEGGRPGGPFGAGEPNLRRKLMHMRAAAENLQMAGMEEVADRIREQIGRMEREGRERGELGGDREPRPQGEGDFRPPQREGGFRGPQGEGDFRPPQGGEGGFRGRRPEGFGAGNPEMQELREQLQQMHRQMEEMRAMMRKPPEEKK